MYWGVDLTHTYPGNKHFGSFVSFHTAPNHLTILGTSFFN